MKIAMVSPYDFSWPGGVNSHVSQLSYELRRKGHDVAVIAPLSSLSTLGDDPIGSQLIPMGPTVPLSAGGSCARVALDPRLYPKVRNLMRLHRFDIVHLHEPLAPILPWMVLQHSQAVNVGTFHAFSEKQRLYRLSRRAVARWQRRLHGRIAVSAAARDFVAPHFPGYCYRVIPNGVDYHRFAGAEPFPTLGDGKRNILFVGRKEERKGLRYLLEAFLILCEQRDDLRLIVVGPGDSGRYCSALIREIAATNAGELLVTGPVGSHDLPRYYASADVFCSPAIGGESFGIVLLEAMAAGAVVVGSNIEGYRDVVSHDVDGLLVAPRDPGAIVAAVAHVVDNTEVSKRLSDAGKQTALKFTWQRVAADIEDYYSQCIKEAKTCGNVG